MKTLPPMIIKNGMLYSQVLRGKNTCIYEVRVSKKRMYYEVFTIKVKNERVVNGKRLPRTEAYPHNEAFGYWAWIFTEGYKAKEKFESLEKGHNK